MTFLQKPVPNFRRIRRREENFHAIFTGITGARDRQFGSIPIEILDLVSRRQFRRAPEKLIEELNYFRPLHRQSGAARAAILKLNPVVEMLLQPGEIFLGARGVDHEKEFLIRRAINDQVIDDSTALVQQKSILAGADFELVDVVGQHAIQPTRGRRTRRRQLTHVRNIEDADVVPHRLMFLGNAGVLHRHEPAAERNNLRAQLAVLLIKRSGFRVAVAHRREVRRRILERQSAPGCHSHTAARSRAYDE